MRPQAFPGRVPYLANAPEAPLGRREERDRPGDAIRVLSHRREVELALEGGTCLFFKHSYRCPVSLDAFNEVVRFTDEHPGLPVLLIDVVSTPELSAFLTARLGLPHASPQLILVSDDEVWWYASHGAIRARAIEDAVRP